MNTKLAKDGTPISWLKTCPYNKSHMVTQDRLYRHLLKCRKTYGAKVIKCAYGHDMYEMESNYHADFCLREILYEEEKNSKLKKESVPLLKNNT